MEFQLKFVRGTDRPQTILGQTSLIFTNSDAPKMFVTSEVSNTSDAQKDTNPKNLQIIPYIGKSSPTLENKGTIEEKKNYFGLKLIKFDM